MNPARRFLSALIFIVVPAAFTQDQNPEPGLTFHAETHLVLVDVVPEYEKKEMHTRALLTDLKREDFRVFDNHTEIPIQSFDAGITHGTRPIALWLIVQCPQGFTAGWASDFVRGNSQALKPALAHLEKDDVVGVAHWCDDGSASVDLEPGRDLNAVLATIERVLGEKNRSVDNRAGELAMQRLVRSIVNNVEKTKPDRLPILLFFYGDHCATYPKEADAIISDVLETSGIVFGISDGVYPFRPDRLFPRNGQIGYLVHYYSQETGGQFYTADPKLFSAALDYILAQLHLRYTLGFKPPVIDGKRHSIKVELTMDAQARYRGVQLRFRQSYVPVARRSIELGK